jgi:hypothetical protein
MMRSSLLNVSVPCARNSDEEHQQKKSSREKGDA